MMDWEDLLEYAISSFGSAPNPKLTGKFNAEAERHPATVKAEVDRIANSYHEGQVRSPWGVMAKKLEELASIAPRVAKGRDAGRVQQRAEQWVRAAGLHFPSWDEVRDELFGDRGQLAEHGDLEPRFEELYGEVRAVGERVELETVERAERWKQQTADAEAKGVVRRHPTLTLEAASDGVCGEHGSVNHGCGEVGPRYRFGRLDLCAGCVSVRQSTLEAA